MSERKPMVLVLAGPNGSCKSTIAQFLDTVGTYTNADDMVASTGMSNEEAAILDRLIHHCEIIFMSGDSYRLSHRKSITR
ncbi:MAG: ATP-binding protein [Oscillospiraceae bacterium]